MKQKCGLIIILSLMIVIIIATYSGMILPLIFIVPFILYKIYKARSIWKKKKVLMNLKKL